MTSATSPGLGDWVLAPQGHTQHTLTQPGSGSATGVLPFLLPSFPLAICPVYDIRSK